MNIPLEHEDRPCSKENSDLRSKIRSGDVSALRSYLQGPQRENFHVHITDIPKIVERGHVELIDFLVALSVARPDLASKCGAWGERPAFFLRLALASEEHETLAEHLWHTSESSDPQHRVIWKLGSWSSCLFSRGIIGTLNV